MPSEIIHGDLTVRVVDGRFFFLDGDGEPIPRETVAEQYNRLRAENEALRKGPSVEELRQIIHDSAADAAVKWRHVDAPPLSLMEAEDVAYDMLKAMGKDAG